MRRAAWLIALAACWKQPGPQRPVARAFELPVRTLRLDNGLRVVAVSDPNAAEIAVTMRYGFGNADDPVGHEGTAHLVEHLMFQQILDGDAVFARLERTTSSFNGFTELDTTTYTARAQPAELAGLLAVEAARLRLRCETITDAVFEREREVVRNELREKADGLALFAALHAGYPAAHPYRHAVETPDTVGAITRAQACAFADERYSPASAVLVVSGNLAAADVERAARVAFAAVPARPGAAPRPLVPAARQDITVKVPLDGIAFVFAWPLPTDPADRARVRALAQMLADHVDADLAGYVASRELGGDRAPSIALVVIPATTESLVQTRAAIARHIEELPTSFTNERSYDDTFEHAQRIALQHLYATLEDGGGRDTDLADHVLAGRDPAAAIASELRAVEKLERTSASQLARTALSLGAASVVTLEPAAARRTGRPPVLDVAIHDAGMPSIPDDATAAHRPAPSLTGTPALARATTRTLPNGLRVVLLPLGGVPTVDIRAIVATGTGDEPGSQRGIALLAAHALAPAEVDIADILDFYTAGGTYDRSVRLDHTTFAVRGLERDIDHLLLGLERLLRNGDYRVAPKIVERMRRAAALPDPDTALEGAWRTAIYGADHPYTRAGLLPQASFGTLDADAAQTFRSRHYRPDATTILIAGGFDPVVADHWVTHLFGSWTSAGTRLERFDVPTRVLPASLAAYDDTSLAAVQLALPVRGSRDQLLLVAELIDRMISDVRHQLGATYNLEVTLDETRLTTQIRIAGYIDASRAADAIALLRDRLAALAKPTDATAATFVAARRRVLGRLRSLTTSADALADRAERAIAAGRAITADTATADAVRLHTIDDLAEPLRALDLARAAIVIRGPKDSVDRAFQILGRTPQVVR